MAITLGNTGSNWSSPGGTSIAASALNLATGSLLVASVRTQSVVVSTVTDTAGNLYYRGPNQTSGSARLEIWWAVNTVANASNVVTATLASSDSFIGVLAAEFLAVATQSPADAWTTHMSQATGGTITSNAFTSTVAEAVIVNICQISGFSTTWTAGSGYTIAVQDSSNVQMLQYQVVSALQSAATASATNSDSSTQKNSMVVVFNASIASGGGGTRGFAFAG